MRTLILTFFTFISFNVHASLNGTYLICERTTDYYLNEKEIFNENYLFIYFMQNKYQIRKVKKHIFTKEIDFSLQTHNSGRYRFDNENIELIDELIFRERKLKSKLDRNTMILQSNFNKTIVFEHLCKKANIKNFKQKSKEIIQSSKKFWKNKLKSNKL